jgi:hypothetical protein
VPSEQATQANIDQDENRKELTNGSARSAFVPEEKKEKGHGITFLYIASTNCYTLQMNSRKNQPLLSCHPSSYGGCARPSKKRNFCQEKVKKRE